MFWDALAKVECEAGEHYFCVGCGHESGRALHVRNMSDANTSGVRYAWTATVSHRTHRSHGADMKGGHAHEESAIIAFDIERKNGDGSTDMVGERIYVIVSDVVGDFYIGILDSQPLCVDPRDDFYLGFGVEVPFTHEHVIEIDRPPEEYIEWQLGQKPEKTWPR